MEVSHLAVDVFHFNLGSLDFVAGTVQVFFVLLGPAFALVENFQLLFDCFWGVAVDIFTFLEGGFLLFVRLLVDSRLDWGA